MPPRAAVAPARDTPSTRDVILDAAEKRFAERGFAAVSVRQIAAEAGLKNQASLYHHFRDKRALYEAVLARGITPIIALVAEGGKSGAGDTALDRVLDYLEEHPGLPRLIKRAGLDAGRYLRTTIGKLLRPLWAQGLDALQAGPWDASQLPHLALGLYHLIFGYFADATLFEVVAQQDPRGAAAVARQRQFVKAAVARLLGGAAPPRAVQGSRRRS